MIDLLVAGGGPAGLATALHARRVGLRVVVAEPRPAPIDKACGEGLMPPAVTALRDLGVEPGGRPFRGIRYTDGRQSATADFRTGFGRGLPRTVLHARMHAAAEAAGVEFVPARVEAVEQDDGSVRAAGVRARWLVGADGLHSRVRAAVGLEAAEPAARPRWGIRAHYGCPPWTDRVEVHWGEHAEAYVTPLGPDCVGVAILGSDRSTFADRLAAFPELAGRLPSEPVERARAAGPLRQRATGRVAGRVLLVGDAAGYVDALTGEGLALGFRSAEALVHRIVAGSPEEYERDYRSITRRYRLITAALLAAAGRRGLRRRIVPLARRSPRLFAAAVHQLER